MNRTLPEHRRRIFTFQETNMSNSKNARYFVARLGDQDFRPTPAAEFMLEVREGNGPPEFLAFIGKDTNHVLVLIHAQRGTNFGRELPNTCCRN